MNNKRRLELALLGLKAEKARIAAEEEEIQKELNRLTSTVTSPSGHTVITKRAPRRRKKSTMSAANREAARIRMTKYWAKRRRAKK